VKVDKPANVNKCGDVDGLVLLSTQRAAKGQKSSTSLFS